MHVFDVYLCQEDYFYAGASFSLVNNATSLVDD